MFISWGKELAKHIRETYRKKPGDDSEIYAVVLVGRKCIKGAGAMNNSVMIALKIGQYNEICR